MKLIQLTLVGSLALAVAPAASAEDTPQPPQRRQLPPEARARLLENFDKDGDGQLSDEERQAAREAFRARTEERRKEMLAKYDKDGDGQLNDEERKTMREQRRKEMLEKYDKDGDGQLSDAERKAAREDMASRRGPRGEGEGQPKAEEQPKAEGGTDDQG